MRYFVGLLVVLSGFAAFPLSAQAQSLDEALRLYKDKDYEEASIALYDVLMHDASADNRDKAQIYLAESLRKADLTVPSLFYYSDLFKAGRNGRYYLNALKGLLDVQATLHDSLFVPTLLAANADHQGFAMLDSESQATVNYLVGEVVLRQRKNDAAKAYLNAVAPESAVYNRARYLLGVMATRQNNLDQAMGMFRGVVERIPADTDDEDALHERNMALIAAARVEYGRGNYDAAESLYDQVPRFSSEWFTSMYENAWAGFQNKDYGKALGELQSVTSPYFAKHMVPEAFVIYGTTYFANCQWDRVRASVERYKQDYEPMFATFSAYLKERRDAANYYEDIVAGGKDHYSEELARQIRTTTRFRDYHYMLTRMDWERKHVDELKTWDGSRLAGDVRSIIDDHRAQLAPAVGQWVHTQLKNVHAQLQNYSNQMNILDFEVSDAERQWLEQGKEILKGRRARVPRPDIPNDQWQHWNFDNEFWKDELGYFQHSLRTECE